MEEFDGSAQQRFTPKRETLMDAKANSPSLLPCIRFYVYTHSEKAAVSFFDGCSELRFKIRFWHCSIQPGPVERVKG